MDIFNLSKLKNIGVSLYLFIYLIIPYSAITQTTKVDLRKDLENALNSKDLKYIKEIFQDKESVLISKKFSKLINEFPDTKWKIKRLKSDNLYMENFQITVIGKKIINKDIYMLESNFNYLFSTEEGKIKKGEIKNLFSTVRNDDKKIDISFKIPDKVLTGMKYDIDIILNKPLEDMIIAGAIKPYQFDSLFDQEIAIEPLVSGGIFKMTRAPSKPGTQIWTGIIAHPNGIITFTKSIDIVEQM